MEIGLVMIGQGNPSQDVSKWIRAVFQKLLAIPLAMANFGNLGLHGAPFWALWGLWKPPIPDGLTEKQTENLILAHLAQ